MELFHSLAESKSQKCEDDSQRDNYYRETHIKDRDHDEGRYHLDCHAGKARDDLGVIVGDDRRVARQAVEPLTGVYGGDAAEIFSKYVMHEALFEKVFQSGAG